MAGILDGIRVIDCTHAQVGPYAGQLLGDLGADVIHVEGPNRPDMTRRDISVHGLPVMLPHQRGSVFFDDHNRNKRAITLDLTSDEGRAVAHEMARRADVFLSNFRAKPLARMGLDYPTLRQINQRIVYATASGVGRRGPEADRASIAFIVDARSGWMMSAGEQGEGPCMVPVGVGDRITSVFLAYGILGALYQREKTGEGQQIHTSQLMSMMTLMGNTISSHLWLGKPFPRFDHALAYNPLYNYYQCKDGRWIALAHRRSDKYWPDFCRVTGLSHLEHDPRFSDSERRTEHHMELLQILNDLFLTKTAKEWELEFRKADLLFAHVQDIPEVAVDPQVVANDYIVESEHPVTGPRRVMGFPVEFSANPCSLRRVAPALGEHSEEVLMEWCGYDWDKILGLRERGIIY